jgi:putative CRISPR-associated protein (TIGR02620 family)
VSEQMVIVTRHAGLVEFLASLGITGDVIGHATADTVSGKNVIGVLPLHLAALAASITTVNIEAPEHLRGTELTYEQVKAHCRGLTTYKVFTANAVNKLVAEVAADAYQGWPSGDPICEDIAKKGVK